MKLTRIVTGDDNQSHFQEESLISEESAIGQLTSAFDVESLFFGEVDNMAEVTWHHAPRPQFVLMLEGAMEIEIGDGTKKIFKNGDLLIAEDLTGQGHITRAATPEKLKYVVIPLK